MKVPNTSIVFATQPGSISRFVFDERTIFGGVTIRTRSAMGPIAEFVYADGKYEFLITMDRIVVGHIGDEILPDQLVEATSDVISTIERHMQTGIVTSVGFNMERVLKGDSEDHVGNALCSALVDVEAVSALVGVKHHQPLVRTVFSINQFSCDVRIEPHFATGGQGLFLTLNVSHDITQSEDLRNITLDPIPIIRSHMEGLLQRGQALMQGDAQ